MKFNVRLTAVLEVNAVYEVDDERELDFAHLDFMSIKHPDGAISVECSTFDCTEFTTECLDVFDVESIEEVVQ